MLASSYRIPRRQIRSRPSFDEALSLTLSDFYREEFVKCQRCLEQQREYYSARTVNDLESALAQIMSRLDLLCTTGNAALIVSRLLRQFDVVAGQANWHDPGQVH
jgi:transcription initiation factor IIE alpha subunit